MNYQQIQSTLDGATAVITLARPERMNALTKVLEAELRDAIEQAGRNPEIRAIVLTGAGRAFCAGMDMDELEVLPPDDIRAEQWMRPYDMNRRADYQTRYSYFPAAPKPIICAINGAAAGLGLVMALYSDFRIASEQAVFATAFAKRGLIAEHGISWMLPRIVGHANATDLLLTSRKIDAAEALRMGLVHRVVAGDRLMPQALALARTLATEVSPRSVRVMKRQLWETPYQTLGEAVALANAEMVTSIQSEDFREGVAHFQERRPARFTGRSQRLVLVGVAQTRRVVQFGIAQVRARGRLHRIGGHGAISLALDGRSGRALDHIPAALEHAGLAILAQAQDVAHRPLLGPVHHVQVGRLHAVQHGAGALGLGGVLGVRHHDMAAALHLPGIAVPMAGEMVVAEQAREEVAEGCHHMGVDRDFALHAVPVVVRLGLVGRAFVLDVQVAAREAGAHQCVDSLPGAGLVVEGADDRMHGVSPFGSLPHGGLPGGKGCRPAGLGRVGRHLPGALRRAGLPPQTPCGFDGILSLAEEPP
jgi:enoyl-CoA hydratase/carnithine racemase